MHGVVLPEADDDWDWELAPFGEAARHRRLVHRVVAFRDWGAVWKRGQCRPASWTVLKTLACEAVT